MDKDHDSEESKRGLLFRAGVATVFSSLLLLPILGVKIGLGLQAGMATVVQFFCAMPLYKEILKKKIEWKKNEHLPIIFGITLAYIYDFFCIYTHPTNAIHFETSCFLITFILIGKIIQEKLKEKAENDLRTFCKLQSKTIRVKIKDEFVSIPVEEASKGDLFEVLPGEIIPADGQIMEGSSVVNEFMLTGEEMTVEKIPGSLVFAGTTNKHAPFIAHVTNVGASTAISRIISMIKTASKTSTSIGQGLKKISSYFAFAIMISSLLTWLIWWGFFGSQIEGIKYAISVLVIASPWIIENAISIVLLVACSKASRYGIFIKEGSAIEKTQKMEEIFVEKKHIVTEGVLNLEKYDVDEKYFPILSNLAKNFNHPASEAMLEVIHQTEIPFLPSMLSFRDTHPEGVSGHFDGRRYFLGSPQYLEQQKIAVDSLQTSSYQENGQVLALATEKIALGYFVFSDQIKEGTEKALKNLKELGVKTILLTDDRRPFAKQLADGLGFDAYEAEVSSQDKDDILQKAKNEKKVVGMIGDGVDDSTALALADIGFATSKGVDVVMESAQIGLMLSHLKVVTECIKLSKTAYKKMRQNKFFAISFNCAGILLASIGYLHPILAGAMGALSTSIIILNAFKITLHHFER